MQFATDSLAYRPSIAVDTYAQDKHAQARRTVVLRSLLSLVAMGHLKATPILHFQRQQLQPVFRAHHPELETSHSHPLVQ
jgi:hypothetical protein